ncbi:MAG: hypothetical protein R3E01_29935 [Pirellulaceae bacterium]|nr:hypothetical protein [Planctomycetales bacterium]
MASGARGEIFDPLQPGVYHCWNRFTRSLFLLGHVMQADGVRIHRMGFALSLQVTLAGLFCVDITSYATLDNHFHMIVRNRPDLRGRLSDREVARRWIMLMRIKRNGRWIVAEPTEKEIDAQLRRPVQAGTRKPGAGTTRPPHPNRASELRERLCDMSWLMGVFEECISRYVNRLDGTKGTCWEGAYQAKKLEDDTATLCCSTYVDLNWIRAAKAKTPEDSTYTSIGERLRDLKRREKEGMSPEEAALEPDSWLSPVFLDERLPINDPRLGMSSNGKRLSDKGYLSGIPLNSYINLVELVGRRMDGDDEGAIPEDLPPIFERMGLQLEGFVHAVKNYETIFGRVVGKPEAVEAHAKANGRNWHWGISGCREAFG